MHYRTTNDISRSGGKGARIEILQYITPIFVHNKFSESYVLVLVSFKCKTICMGKAERKNELLMCACI